MYLDIFISILRYVVFFSSLKDHIYVYYYKTKGKNGGYINNCNIYWLMFI